MNLNKVFVLGNLTRDPELRQTPGGQAVCSFAVATNRFYNDSSGQKQKQAEFHNVVAWGRQAEIVNQYLRKGSPVLVEGRLQTRSWQGKDGVKRYSTEIVAENLQLGPKAAGISAPPVPSAPRERDSVADEQIPVIEPDAPLANPIGKDESAVEESEIYLKDIPF